MVSNTKLTIVLIASILVVTLAIVAGTIGKMRFQTGRECSRRHLNVSPTIQGGGGRYRSVIYKGIGDYWVRVEVGNPPQSQYLVVDTGSVVTWVQCSDCNPCYPQRDPIFNPAASTSFCHKSCDSKACKSLGDAGECQFVRNRCNYKIKYVDGSVTKGILMAERIRIGSGVVGVAIGCGKQNEGTFKGMAGIMGLGNGSTSFVNQLGVDGFTYCLGSSIYQTGWLEFGSSVFPPNASWVPLLHNPKLPSRYYIKLFGIEVGRVRLPIAEEDFQLTKSGQGGVVLDSGSVLTWFPRKIYEVLREEFKTQVGINFPSAPPRGNMDTCYYMDPLDTVMFPSLTFYFDGTNFTVGPYGTFTQVDNIGTNCLAFTPHNSTYSIIGNVQQAGAQISYDLRRGQVGFGPTNVC